jgi:hypothetical protein
MAQASQRHLSLEVIAFPVRDTVRFGALPEQMLADISQIGFKFMRSYRYCTAI